MCISVLDRLERSRSLLSLSRGRRRSVRRRRRFRAVLEINFRNGTGIFWPMASLSNAAKIAADIACALRLALIQNLLCHPEISFENRSRDALRADRAERLRLSNDAKTPRLTLLFRSSFHSL